MRGGTPVSKFHLMWENPSSAVIALPAFDFAVLAKVAANELKPDEFEALRQMAKETFMRCPDTDELPVVDEAGNIRYVLAKDKEPRPAFPWKNRTANTNRVLAFMADYRKIYVSSLKNKNLREFFCEYCSSLPLDVLNHDNLQDALKSRDSLLLYAEDIFPANTNKL